MAPNTLLNKSGTKSYQGTDTEAVAPLVPCLEMPMFTPASHI